MSENKSMKTSAGKLRYELVPPHVYEGLALGYEEGAQKYQPGDWEKLDVETLMGAVFRHLNAIRKGEIFDTDTKMKLNGQEKIRIQHAYLAMTSISMISELLRKDVASVDQGRKALSSVQQDTGGVLPQPSQAV